LKVESLRCPKCEKLDQPLLRRAQMYRKYWKTNVMCSSTYMNSLKKWAASLLRKKTKKHIKKHRNHRENKGMCVNSHFVIVILVHACAVFLKNKKISLYYPTLNCVCRGSKS